MSDTRRDMDEAESSRFVRTTSTVRSISSQLRWCSSSNSNRPTYQQESPVSHSSIQSTSSLSSPPPPPSPSTPAKLTLPPNTQIVTGIKHYGPRMRLYCRTGFCLTILRDGNVIGDPLGNHTSGVLEFTSAGIGEVRIRGAEANLYLAMNRKGSLYGEEDPRDYATVFVESTYGQYNIYLSQKYAHKGWYIGIKKNGAIKKASQTKWGQKAIQFLPIRS